MAAGIITTERPRPARAIKWLPLALLPGATLLLAHAWPAWMFMWTLAFALYLSFKWLALADFVNRFGWPSWPRMLGFLLLWPGMDADAFFDTEAEVKPPAVSEWAFALAKIALGCAILFAVAPMVLAMHPLAGGWVGMIGVAFILHFGVIHLLALLWRRAGVNVTPIMQAPILANSVSDFWSRRWNLAFRDLVHRFIFRPVARKHGAKAGMAAVFLASGLIHDFVISLTAGGGYGLPTLYFCLQGGALLLERSRTGKKLDLRGGLSGRIFTALVVAVPMMLLFPPVFVERIVVPMLKAIDV